MHSAFKCIAFLIIYQRAFHPLRIGNLLRTLVMFFPTLYLFYFLLFKTEFYAYVYLCSGYHVFIAGTHDSKQLC